MSEREKLLREEIIDVEVSPKMSICDLVEAYGSIHGFMAGHLYRAIEILGEAVKRAELRFLSFTANLVSTGLRGILAQLIREKIFNVVVTTSGALDHDIARGFGGKYYKGYFEADDSYLASLEIHRLGNVFIPLESYGMVIEKTIHDILDEVSRDKKEWSIYELLWEIGSRISDKHSILRAAYEKKIPVIVPGWPDGAFGTALFTYSQVHGLKIDYMKDMSLIAEKVFSNKGLSAALIIGGGISKHHVIWWSQFMDGLDYVVYITTAVEYDGSLSGAHPREAVSWGKVKPQGKKAIVYGDATIILPIIAACLIGEKD